MIAPRVPSDTERRGGAARSASRASIAPGAPPVRAGSLALAHPLARSRGRDLGQAGRYLVKEQP